MKRLEGTFGLSARLTGGGIDNVASKLICDELASEPDFEADSEIDNDWVGAEGLGERFGARAGGIIVGFGDFRPELLNESALGGGINGVLIDFCGDFGETT